MPKRIQLRRTRGWRLPANAVIVSRPSRYGNPYKLTDYHDGCGAPLPTNTAAEMAVRDYELALHTGRLKVTEEDVRRELRGKDLGCWCPVDAKHCHADVLLRVAAEKESPRGK